MGGVRRGRGGWHEIQWCRISQSWRRLGGLVNAVGQGTPPRSYCHHRRHRRLRWSGAARTSAVEVRRYYREASAPRVVGVYGGGGETFACGASDREGAPPSPRSSRLPPPVSTGPCFLGSASSEGGAGGVGGVTAPRSSPGERAVCPAATASGTAKMAGGGLPQVADKDLACAVAGVGGGSGGGKMAGACQCQAVLGRNLRVPPESGRWVRGWGVAGRVEAGPGARRGADRSGQGVGPPVLQKTLKPPPAAASQHGRGTVCCTVRPRRHKVDSAGLAAGQCAARAEALVRLQNPGLCARYEVPAASFNAPLSTDQASPGRTNTWHTEQHALVCTTHVMHG